MTDSKTVTAALSPVAATLAGWLAVALYHLGDIALLPLGPEDVSGRVLHAVIDLGHVLAVALAIAAAVALFPRLAARFEDARLASISCVALAASAFGLIVVAGDLEGAFDRWMPEASSDWPRLLGSVAVAQTITGCFVLGRFCARPRWRVVAVAAGMALIAANAFVLKNGYPGAHVLLSTSGATLIAASLAFAVVPPRFAWLSGSRAARTPPRGVLRWLRPATVAWAIAVTLAMASVVRAPPSGVQVELLERDTPLLFPWLRRLYAPAPAREITIPRELLPAFEHRSQRPDIPPPPEQLLPEGPIVVMITIDALRYDLLEPRHRQVAPNLHEIRANGVYFTQARSSASDTNDAMATLFTGLHHSMLNWTGRRRSVTLKRERRPRFPELLQKAGVETVIALGVTMLQPRKGIALGFGERLRWRDGTDADPSAKEDVADRVVERLRTHGKKPLFFYTHLMDPHAPYEANGKPPASQFEAYLSAVSRADAKVGKIRRAISEFGLARRTALIIGADHGEGFGEHGIFTHGKSFYDVLVRVPMMIELPGIAPRTVNDFVAVMDLGPTVLDLFRVPTPGHFMAETLTPYLLGRRGNPHRLLLMEKPTHRAMLFPDGLKVMERRGAYELYDVLRDPDEEDDLWAERGDEGQRRLALLRAYVRAHAARRASDAELD
jgi:hypothetical protein